MDMSKIVVPMVAAAMLGAALAADAPTANIQLTMLTQVNPQGLAFWEITNQAPDDNGGVDGSKLTSAQWAKLVEIGRAIEAGGRALGTNRVIAAAPGSKLQDESNEGAAKAPDVQRYVDAKAALFKSQALQLQKTGAAIVTAATKRNGKQLGELAGSLDGVCENCHVAFWYPQQRTNPR